MTTDTGTPKPGSPEAIAAGCKCPAIDNHHGRGYRGQAGIYVYDMQCEVHRWKDWEDGSGWGSR